MTTLALALTISGAFVCIAVAGVAWRLLRGPSSADRVIALDMLGLIAIVIAALVAAVARHQGFLDVAFGIALFAFLATVGFAGLLERAGNPQAPPAKEDR